MTEYHKIQTIFFRDPETKFRTLLDGRWALPEFGYLADCEWVFTEKVDGTNIRLIWDGAKWAVGGRTDAAQIPAFLLDPLNGYAERLGDVFGETPAVVYGEGYGSRIQKGGGNYRPDADFVAFDVRAGATWLERSGVADVAGKLGCDVVPEIGGGTLCDAIGMARRGFDSAWGAFRAEGLIARPRVELKDRRGNRIIAKVKCKDFA